MKQSLTNHLSAAYRQKGHLTGAFTLTELLFVLGATAVLAVVLLSVAFTTGERVMRAQCVDNLRQIGVGINVYADENNGYVPVCGWQNGGNPWETYEVCRMDAAGSTNVIRGFYNLGMLFQTKAVTDTRIFYCPSLAHVSQIFSYDFYATLGWPSTSANLIGVNPYIRAGYTYYPQLRATTQLTVSGSRFTVPVLSYSTVQLEFGGLASVVSPARWTDLDPKKSITTDMVDTTNELSHRSSGSVAGLNALFPDGRVMFQNARTDPRTLYNSPWYSPFWANGGPLSDPSTFRVVMSEWEP